MLSLWLAMNLNGSAALDIGMQYMQIISVISGGSHNYIGHNYIGHNCNAVHADHLCHLRWKPRQPFSCHCSPSLQHLLPKPLSAHALLSFSRSPLFFVYFGFFVYFVFVYFFFCSFQASKLCGRICLHLSRHCSLGEPRPCTSP